MLYRKPYTQYLLEELEIEIGRIYFVAILDIKRECRKMKFISRIARERWK